MNWETLNVVQLGCGFFLVFFAFNSAGFIEQTVIATLSKDRPIGKHAGYNRLAIHRGNCSVVSNLIFSLAIIYAVFTLSNFVAAPIVHKIGARYALVLGA